MTTQMPIGFTPKDIDAKVNCGTCTACCRKEMVLLVDGDDPANYPEAIEVEWDNPFTGEDVARVIPHAPNGACIYLGKNGCTIYDKRPKMCRVFSCVGFVNRVLELTARNQRRQDFKAGNLDHEVWKAGMDRRERVS